jgi:hypothetical protein
MSILEAVRDATGLEPGESDNKMTPVFDLTYARLVTMERNYQGPTVVTGGERPPVVLPPPAAERSQRSRRHRPATS